MKAAVVALLVMMTGARALHAQSVDPRLDSRLEGRIDARARAALADVIDSARSAGIPVEPLIDKALEGASKGADAGRIITAVRAMAQRLDIARRSLGVQSSEADLVAGAAALQAGTEPATLGKLRTARQHESVAIALVVLADLVTKHVPVDTASKLILALASNGAGDNAFLALRRDIARDIVSGAPPVVAAAVRTQGALGTTTVEGAGVGPAAVSGGDKPRKKP